MVITLLSIKCSYGELDVNDEDSSGEGKEWLPVSPPGVSVGKIACGNRDLQGVERQSGREDERDSDWDTSFKTLRQIQSIIVSPTYQLCRFFKECIISLFVVTIGFLYL